MNFRFFLILINYMFFTVVSLLLSLIPLTYSVYFVVQQSDYIYYFALTIILPVMWLISFLIFITLHGRIVVRLTLPKIIEGSYPIRSHQNLIYSIRLSADNIAKYWCKTFEIVPFLTQLYLNKLFLQAYGVKFGKNAYISTEVRIDGVPLIKFGDNLFIGPRAIIGAHINHGGSEHGGNILYKRVEVGNNCFIGNNAVLTPGGKMGNNSILGGFSIGLLDTVIPDGETWVGMPAKPLKKTN